MANISEIVKVNYTLTAADKAAGVAIVPIRWRSPFYDTHYSLSVLIEDVVMQNPSAANPFGTVWNCGVTAVTPQGFTAVVAVEGAATTAGDKITIHAMASHQ
jgi:hypothetical protein